MAGEQLAQVVRPRGGARDWPAQVAAVLEDRDRLQLVFQPVVDLARGVVAGYEALARFREADGAPSPWTPDVWFAEAGRCGLGAALEGVVVERCLALRATLPPNCFLTVNVSPHLLLEPELAGPLLTAGDLAPLVLELTEHHAVRDLVPLVALRDELSARGALVALDDAGSGYSGLQQITQFRPHVIKLDRSLVQDADRDEVKLALAEVLGHFGARVDAWLLAEGVETWNELEAFLRLGVPLGQGYLLGRPAPPWAGLDPATAARLRSRAARARLGDHVASLVEAVPVEGVDPVGPSDTALRVDATGRPVALLLPRRRSDDEGPGHRAAPVLRVPASAGVVELAQRVVTRDPASRFDPVVVVDDVGAATGVVRVERLLTHLAARCASGRDGR